MHKQLLEKLNKEKERMPTDKKALIIEKFPKFLQELSEEISNENSPIWDEDFKFRPPPFLMNQLNRTLPLPTPNSPNNKKQQNLLNNNTTIQKSPSSSKKKETGKKQVTTTTILNEKRHLELDEDNQNNNKRSRIIQGNEKDFLIK